MKIKNSFKNGHIKTTLRVALSVAAIWALLVFVPLRDIGKSLKQANILWIMTAIISGYVVMLLQAFRWKTLYLDSPSPSLYFFWKYIAIGCFANVFLPSSIGGDLVKSITLARNTGKKKSAILSTIMSRFLGVSVLLAFFWSSWWAGTHSFPQIQKIELGLGILSATMFLAWLFLFFPRLKALSGFESKFRAGRFRPVWDSLFYYQSKKKSLITGFTQSFLIQLSTIFLTWTTFKAIGVDLPFLDVIQKVPLIILFSMIPLTVLNIGVREGITIWVFSQVPGVEAEHCIAATMIGYIVVLTQAIAGIPYLKLKTHPAPDSDSGR